MCQTKVNSTHGMITMFKTYQGAPYRLFKKKFKSMPIKKELDELEEMVLKYNPTYTKKDIKRLYYELKEKGCTYASLANVIIEQSKYDDDTFRELFGYSMYKEDGSIQYNKIMIHLYACLADMVEANVHEYQVYHFDSVMEAAETLLHKRFEKDMEAHLALFDSGWIPNGVDESGKIIFKSRTCKNATYLGTYASIAKEIFGIEYLTLSKEDFCQLLKENNMECSISFENPESKLSGLVSSSNINLWINKFFEVNQIDLSLKAENIDTRNVSYEDFMLDIYTRKQNGYSIGIGIPVDSNIFMTDGKSWENPSSKSAGHQMNFQNFDHLGNIVVSSWGKTYVIPKCFYKELEYDAIRIERKRKKGNSK